MTAKELEEFYDAEIAPALMDIAKKCQDKGLSMFANVEWDVFEGARTTTFTDRASIGMHLCNTCIRAQGNVDALFLAIERYARKHGHSSMYLHVLGVPSNGKKEPTP